MAGLRHDTPHKKTTERFRPSEKRSEESDDGIGPRPSRNPDAAIASVSDRRPWCHGMCTRELFRSLARVEHHAACGLSRVFSRFMQATMRSTFGNSRLHSRNTSGVQAARSSADPTARLWLANEVVAARRTTANADFNLEVFPTICMFSPAVCDDHVAS